MNLRNLGIVFSPTLAIPAPLFALFLLEFDVSPLLLLLHDELLETPELTLSSIR